jgi:hypothetical protein
MSDLDSQLLNFFPTPNSAVIYSERGELARDIIGTKVSDGKLKNAVSTRLF